jgi:hypothetical protein
MSCEHFILEVTRAGQPHYLIWFSDQQDGVITGDDLRPRTFARADEAFFHSSSAGFELGDESITRYDFDEIDAWTRAPERGCLTPHCLLGAWNLMADIATSVGDRIAMERLLGRRSFPAYDRLIHSCDLPALGTTASADPLTASDHATIAAALRHGIACFDRAVPLRRRGS